MPNAAPDPLLRVDGLCVHFRVRDRAAPGGWLAPATRVLRAVEDVSVCLSRGGALGVVGESGCGKSTLARAILRLVPASAGRVWFDGLDLFGLPRAELRRARRRMQLVFQDPAASLNPRMSVASALGEPLAAHGIVRTAHERRERVADLLERVGLPAQAMWRRPHEFSGGQRQRIVIARALALGPELLVCDEPVSALDVSVRAQILNLLADLRRDLGLTIVLIAHDLSVVEHFCDHVAVMYLGRIVETAPTDRLFADPRHPYTQALLAAAPRIDAADPARASVPAVRPVGEPPSPLDPPDGCAFHPRCPLAEDRCRRERPALAPPTRCPSDHLVACHLADRTAWRDAPPAARPVPSG